MRRLENLITIEDLARKGRCNEALRMIDEMASQYPKELKIWALRGFINRQRKDYIAAVDDWSNAISIRDDEPHCYYSRARNLFSLGDFDKAVADLDMVIRLSEKHKSEYYRTSAYIIRADAHLRLGLTDKAIADCQQVPAGMRIWTDKMRSREEILIDCRQR